MAASSSACDEIRFEDRHENRFECGFEFKCVFDAVASRVVSSEIGFARRIQVCLRESLARVVSSVASRVYSSVSSRVASRVVSSVASRVYSSVSSRRARLLCHDSGDQLRGDNCECERMRVAACPTQCHSEARANASADSCQFHHAVDSNYTVEVLEKTRTVGTDAAKVKQDRTVAIEEMRFENQGLRSNERFMQLEVRAWCKT